MTTYAFPHFGNLPIGNLEEYYQVKIDFNGTEIQMDLNFEHTTIETSTIDEIKNFIENIDKFNMLNKSYILNDYNDEEGDTVKFYINHHLDEVSKDELSKLIDVEVKSIEQEMQLLNQLKLMRVGLYPHNEESFAIFDYSIGQDISSYLVVINTNKNGELIYMTMES